jgi:hypothetical protein
MPDKFITLTRTNDGVQTTTREKVSLTNRNKTAKDSLGNQVVLAATGDPRAKEAVIRAFKKCPGRPVKITLM